MTDFSQLGIGSYDGTALEAVNRRVKEEGDRRLFPDSELAFRYALATHLAPESGITPQRFVKATDTVLWFCKSEAVDALDPDGTPLGVSPIHILAGQEPEHDMRAAAIFMADQAFGPTFSTQVLQLWQQSQRF